MNNKPYSSQDVLNGAYDETQKAIRIFGGSEGTTNYNLLTNKPKINSITLSGNLSGSDLGLVDSSKLGAPGGVATLDQNSKLSVQALPLDGVTLSVSSGVAKATGLVETNSGSSEKIWVGTLQEYVDQNKSSSQDLCFITDDSGSGGPGSGSGVRDVVLPDSSSVVSSGVASLPMAGESSPGLVFLHPSAAFSVGTSGKPECSVLDYSSYTSYPTSTFLSKGTLERRLCPRIEISSAPYFNPVHGVCFLHTWVEGESAEFGPAPAGFSPQFEFWISTSQSAGVAFSTPIVWGDSNRVFSSSNPPPSFQLGKVYHLVFQWTGSKWWGWVKGVEEE